jgi:autotransporter-associated beta strand protein
LTIGDSGNSAASVRTLYASGGARTLGNSIVFGTAALVQTNIITGSQNLTLAGSMDLGTASRLFIVDNSGVTTFAGPISNGGITKEGAGLLRLNGTNTYTGDTIVAGGTLGGTGVVAGNVTVNAGGTLAPGAAAIGKLTVNGALTLGGSFSARVNSAGTPNCDQVEGATTVTYGGTLNVVNGGPALTAADSFPLFSATTYAGAFASISPATPGAGLQWNTNTLTTDGTLRISAIGGGPSTTPTNVTAVFTSTDVTLSWPASHLGWTLQVQTNARSVGLTVATNTWFDVVGSAATNSVTIPTSKADPTVFYRLRLPQP